MDRQGAAVAAARALVGTRFRLHGRDAHGLDCVGLVAAALRAVGHEGAVPTGYAMRGGSAAHVATMLEAAGLVRAEGLRPGDVLLVEAGAAQLHLVLLTDGGFVHACAGLRRVVEAPGTPAGRIVGGWRMEG